MKIDPEARAALEELVDDYAVSDELAWKVSADLRSLLLRMESEPEKPQRRERRSNYWNPRERATLGGDPTE